MWRGRAVLTADRAWLGHGPWLKGTGLGCRGWFCWAGPSLWCCCYCCHCCWCCCWDSGWVEPWGVTAWRWVARIEGEAFLLMKLPCLLPRRLPVLRLRDYKNALASDGPRVASNCCSKMHSATVAHAGLDIYNMEIVRATFSSHSCGPMIRVKDGSFWNLY